MNKCVMSYQLYRLVPKFWSTPWVSLIQPQTIELGKSSYFTSLDFPEIRGFAETSATFWGENSCEVAIIWRDVLSASTWMFFGIHLLESADMPNQVVWSRQIIIKIMIAIIKMIKITVYIRTDRGTNICLLTRFLSSHMANQQNSNKRNRNNPQNTNTKTKGN